MSIRNPRGGRTRAVQVGALAMVAAIVLAACQGAPGGSATKGGDAIKLGAIISTTGTLAPFGTDALPAIQLFAEEINAKGGINGKQLQVINIDDESKPENAVSAAKRLIQQEKVSAIVGPVSAVVSAAVSPIANESEVPAMGCGCIYGPMTKYEFSVFPSRGMMTNQAQFAKSQGVTRIAIVSQAGALAETIQKVNVPELQAEGIEIVAFEQFQPTDTDLTPILAKLRSQGVQHVYVAASGTPAATAAKNFKQLNYPGQYWTFAGNANEAFIKLVGESADVVNLAGTKILVHKELPDNDPLKPRLAEFATKYEAKAGKEAGTYAAFFYDVMLSYADAIAKGGTEPAKIREALENQKGLQVLNGTINRSATEHNGLDPEWLSVKINPQTSKFTIRK